MASNCNIKGCDRVHYANGLCNTHYARQRKTGSVELIDRPAPRCSVSGCDQKVTAQSLCSMHYTRLRRHGSTEDPTPTFEQRFWSKARKTDGCWVWLAGKDKDGYGNFSVGQRATARPVRAHRVAWELTHGSIPDGLFVLHECDNPPCVRPDHLFLGTNQNNMDDMVAKGRGSIGIRNGKYTQPERTPRGDQHWKRRSTKTGEQQ